MYRFILQSILVTILLFLTSCTSMQGRSAIARGDWDTAIVAFEEVLESDPGNQYARNRLGFAYLKTGRLEEAEAQFERELEQRPGDPYAVLYLGLTQVNQGRYAEAAQTWKSYRNSYKPGVEAEIKKQITILQVKAGQEMARRQVAKERSEYPSVSFNSVAVCPFRNELSDPKLAAFDRALCGLLTTDLARIESLNVIERLQMQALVKELGVSQSGLVDPLTAPRIGRLAGAEHLVLGRVFSGSVQVQAHVANENKVTGSFQVASEQDRFYELEKAVLFHTVEALGVELTSAEKEQLSAYATTDLEAFLFYGQALSALDDGNWERAKDLFDKALRADPSFTPAREGRDHTPDRRAPSVQELEQFEPEDFAEVVETSVVVATEQGDSDVGGNAESGVTGGGGHTGGDGHNGGTGGQTGGDAF